MLSFCRAFSTGKSLQRPIRTGGVLPSSLLESPLSQTCVQFSAMPSCGVSWAAQPTLSPPSMSRSPTSFRVLQHLRWWLSPSPSLRRRRLPLQPLPHKQSPSRLTHLPLLLFPQNLLLSSKNLLSSLPNLLNQMSPSNRPLSPSPCLSKLLPCCPHPLPPLQQPHLGLQFHTAGCLFRRCPTHQHRCSRP
jgi:hypothetical protein